MFRFTFSTLMLLLYALGYGYTGNYQSKSLENQAKIMSKVDKIVSSTAYWDIINDKVRSKIEAHDKILRKLDLEMVANKKKILALNSEVKYWREKGQGSVFIRWGRTDCPLSTSRIVYSGLVGGSYYAHFGGATTYLCLPKVPQTLSNLPNVRTYLYGGEYDMTTFGHADGDDVPCAVCRSTRGTQTVMVPARISCYDGWTRQYYGYLGTEYQGHRGNKEYICIDKNSQARHGGRHNYNGALIEAVRAHCGALPCPPYKSGDTITCVVCSL